MDEGRKRVLAILAGILLASHLKTTERLVWWTSGQSATDKLIAAAVQWAERIMRKVDACARLTVKRGLGALTF